MKIGYSYIRFSTDIQELGSSTQRQTENGERCAKERGIEIDYSFNLKDLGVSGFRGKNIKEGALGHFLKAVESGKIKPGSYLLVESFDRLSRQEPLKTFKLFERLVEAGIRIVTTADNQEYSSETIRKNPAQLFVLLGVMMRAHEESKTKSERIAASYKARREKLIKGEKPLMGKSPSWIDSIKGKHVLNEEKSLIVREMIQLALKGRGSTGIAKDFNQRKVPLIGTGEAWGGPTILHILRSRRLIGEFEIDGSEPIKNYYPALITEKQFIQLQAVLAKRSGARGPAGKFITNIFGDKLISGTDESRMILTQKKRASEPFPISILVSTNMLNGLAQRCGFSYSEFENHFLNWVTEVQIRNGKQNDNVEFLESQLSEIKGKNEKLKKRMDSLPEDAFDSCLEKVIQYDKLIKKLKNDIEQAKNNKQYDIKSIKTLMNEMEGLEGQQRIDVRHKLKMAVGDVLDYCRIYTYAKFNGVRLAVCIVKLKDKSFRMFIAAYSRSFSKSFEVSDKLVMNEDVDWKDVQKLVDDIGETWLEKLSNGEQPEPDKKQFRKVG